MTEKNYRKDMPPMPDRILALPETRGYPVPWFVAKVDGVYDFRVIAPGKIVAAIKRKLCWICGDRLGKTLAFTIGPMCAVNRISSEPPAHHECAEWSARACPFLTQKQIVRRETNMPEGTKDAAGFGIKRQPGVALVWLTESYQPFKVDDGLLIKIGPPLKTLWFRQGREATRDEVLESIESGLPILREMAQLEGKAAIDDLEAKIIKGLQFVPSGRTAPKLKLGIAARR